MNYDKIPLKCETQSKSLIYNQLLLKILADNLLFSNVFPGQSQDDLFKTKFVFVWKCFFSNIPNPCVPLDGISPGISSSWEPLQRSSLLGRSRHTWWGEGWLSWHFALRWENRPESLPLGRPGSAVAKLPDDSAVVTVVDCGNVADLGMEECLRDIRKDCTWLLKKDKYRSDQREDFELENPLVVELEKVWLDFE